ncbi:FHA domain-containing protein [Alienimonas chondri]|uniref:FHA domain-containing protein n=1 Tax=Alienimonas chondri TaxID=2681879 RepID=A0ABX1VED2_9PLAN|nr:FHA domain-containing protein [Alienimonas chondri]NNJ26336.1 hypothetical protein [Alienimonas chondri]
MAAEFLLPRAEGRPLTVRLERDAVVGRGTDAGLRISSRRVSRSHCRLTVDGSVVRVRDLGSRNGTFVNGEGVGDSDMEVPLGGTLSIGGVTMKLVRAGDRHYRPDGVQMLKEVESHHPEGELQDSPSGVVVGQEAEDDLSDDSVLVTDSELDHDAGLDRSPRDKPDLPSPVTERTAETAAPGDPVVVEDDPVPDSPIETSQAEQEEFVPDDPAVEDLIQTEDIVQPVSDDEAAEVDADEVVVEAVDSEVTAEENEDESVDESPEESLVDDEAENEGESDSERTPGAAEVAGGSPASFGGEDGNDTVFDEDAAFAFLNEDGNDGGDADSTALKALPGAGDSEDQSSFAGFQDNDDEQDVDSTLLGFLNDPK